VDLLAFGGRLVQIAVLRGAKAEFNPRAPSASADHRHRVDAAFRSVEEKGAIAAAVEHAGLAPGRVEKIRPVVYATLPLTEAAEAHRVMESGSHIGKIVLTV
jgi:NADPH:quinone reductase-like Zn-dependent oxidoreductase